jgi:hypothetical protein
MAFTKKPVKKGSKQDKGELSYFPRVVRKEAIKFHKKQAKTEAEKIASGQYEWVHSFKGRTLRKKNIN